MTRGILWAMIKIIFRRPFACPMMLRSCFVMNDRSEFRYELHWHTKFPLPCALSSNRVFYQHLSTQQLKEKFTSLHSKGSHPFLMATHHDFEQIKQRIGQDATAAQFYNSVYSHAQQLLDTQPPITPERHTLQNRLLPLCMAYKISGEKQFLHRAWQELEQYCHFTTWMYTEKLDAGYILKGIAIGYDWLYHDLSEEQREIIRTAVLKNAFWTEIQVYRNPYRKGLDAHYVLQNTNHNVSINCGLIMAACALMDDPEIAEMSAEIIESALWALENYLPEFLEHGCGKEGVYYWYWPMTSVMEIITSLQTTFGSDFGISQTPGFEKMGFFPVYMTGATGKEFNWGNASENVFAISEALFAFANILGDDRFALCRKKGLEVYGQTPNTYDLLWYRPCVQQTLNLPLDMKFDRTESVGMFSSLFDPNAISVCIKGGFNNEVHGSLCGGSFVIDAGNERWASLPGAEKYSVPHYWDYSKNGTRWTYYRMRAEGQNAMVLNPSCRPEQNPFAFCPVKSYQSTAESCCAVIDLSPAFAEDSSVDSAMRSAMLTNHRTDVLLKDEVCGKDIDYWWMMQTTAQITLSANKRTAILQQNGKQMEVCLLSQPEAVFETAAAEPLPSSPHPAENSPNPTLQKLIVHLPHVSKVELSIQFHLVQPQHSTF